MVFLFAVFYCLCFVVDGVIVAIVAVAAVAIVVAVAVAIVVAVVAVAIKGSLTPQSCMNIIRVRTDYGDPRPH